MIILSLPKRLHSTYYEKLIEGQLDVLFAQHIENVRYDDPDEIAEFDLLCECSGIVVLPEAPTHLNKQQVYEMKVADQLHKPVYMITPENTVIRAEITHHEPKRVEPTPTG